MAGQKWNQMFGDADRSHAGTTTTMRDTESLVQVQMAHISADKAGRGQPHLRVHVCTIHINLAAVRRE